MHLSTCILAEVSGCEHWYRRILEMQRAWTRCHLRSAAQSKYSRNSSPACNGCHDDHPFTVLTETKFSRLKTHQPGTDEKGVEEFIVLCRERDARFNSVCRQLHAVFSQRLLEVFSLHGALDPKCVNRVEDRRAISPTLN
jgi:hypothetical protein